jgi:peroxiredoxin
MKRLLCAAMLSMAWVAAPVTAGIVGQPAPDFTLTDLQGKTVTLSLLKGKFVVLEWVNPECPFVNKHYSSGNMQKLQKEATTKHVTWLSIHSTRPSHSDYKTPDQMRAWTMEQKGAPTTTLLDPDGKVGKLYGARTTPHMYIIDPKGELIYAGAIDSKRSSNPSDIDSATNYVRVALNEAWAGKPVTTAATTPYGCSVKY